MKKTGQKDRVLKYCKDFGYITSWDAFQNFGITRLSAIIFNLKKQGFDFKDEMIYTTNRYEEKTHFKKYILI